MLWWLVAGLAAAVVAVVAEPKWVLAPFVGFAVLRVGFAMLRSMAAGGPTERAPEPVVDRPERTLYWCEECGAELLLVVRGTDVAPRHCGERMHERVELVGSR